MDRIRERDPTAWPKVRVGVERALAEYDALGCTTSFGEWQQEVNAIAIAFTAPGARSIMAINCGGPGFNLSPEFLLGEVRPQLLALAGRLEQPGTVG
jgi:DNA-binding IclR family transcriptional regulator